MFLIQRGKKFFQIRHLFDCIWLDLARFIFGQFCLVASPLGSLGITFYFWLLTGLRTHTVLKLQFLMNLIGRNILILGGNGYLGNYFGARLVQMKANVMSLSRSQTKYEYPENNVIHWLRGSVLDPEALKPEINRADTIIHTIGTLVDTSVTRRTQPGGQGTYEQMNRDTLSSIMSVLDEPKKIIFISSGAHPPFLKRYLDAKHEAQELLFASKHEGYSLRPGFVYSWQHRKWSIPLKWPIDVWNGISPAFFKVVPEKSKVREYLDEFKQAQTLALEDLGDAVIEVCMHGSRKKVNQVVDIKTLCEKFRNEQRI